MKPPQNPSAAVFLLLTSAELINVNGEEGSLSITSHVHIFAKIKNNLPHKELSL